MKGLHCDSRSTIVSLNICDMAGSYKRSRESFFLNVLSGANKRDIISLDVTSEAVGFLSSAQ